jgi:hypothetical protein
MIDWSTVPKDTKVFDSNLNAEGYMVMHYGPDSRYAVHIVFPDLRHGETYTTEEADARLKLV